MVDSSLQRAAPTLMARPQRAGLLIRSSNRKWRMQTFALWLWIMMVPIGMVLVAGAPAATPAATTAAAPPTTTANPAAPPPTTTKAPPPTANITAAAPKATPPVVTAAPPPKATPVATPPAANSSTVPAAAPPPTTPTSPPPKTIAPASPPKVASAPPPKEASAPPPKVATAPPPKSTTAPSLPPASAPSPSSPSDLDASQVHALRQLKVPFDAAHPCNTSTDILLCDNSGPPRHLTSLSLRNCPANTNFTTEALVNLSTLQNLELVNCSVKPVHVPQVLVKSLTTFICTQSLGRTGENPKADKLSGVWLSTLTSLEELWVMDVEVTVSGLSRIVQDMTELTQLRIERTNIPGELPRNTWPKGLETIDLSGNSIRGTLPSTMRSLSGLKHLDLSDNQIKGVLPNIFGDLQQLQYIDLSGNQFSGPIPGSLASLRNCSHLDLSNNQLNGSIPANITLIKTLRYLDLSHNELSGPIPFNSTFLNKLTTLKLGENAGLCYNHTELKSKFLTGIRNCVSVEADTSLFAPAPAPSSDNLSASSGKTGRISKGAAAGISIVVILAVAGVAFLVVRWRRSRDESEQFVNLRKDRP